MITCNILSLNINALFIKTTSVMKYFHILVNTCEIRINTSTRKFLNLKLTKGLFKDKEYQVCDKKEQAYICIPLPVPL